MTADIDKHPVAPAGSGKLAFVATLSVAAAVDIGLVVAATAFPAFVWAAVAVHFCLAPLIWLCNRRSADSSIVIFAVVAVLVAGPVGALGTLFVSGQLRGGKPSGNALHALRRPPSDTPSAGDLSTELSGSIAEGRARRASESGVRDFRRIMATGCVADKQTMLGLISQRFDPDYTSVLKNALRSEEAAVRVSAAAVFAKLREADRKSIVATATTDSTFLLKEQALARVRILVRGVMNGLLDPTGIAAARREALDILLGLRPGPTVADEIEELLCTLLFQSGRDGELAERLGGLDVSGSKVLGDLSARILMEMGQYQRAAGRDGNPAEQPVRLGRQPNREDGRALLATPFKGGA